MNISDYGQLAVIEKALRQQALSVAERRTALHLAETARVAKDTALSVAVFGNYS